VHSATCHPLIAQSNWLTYQWSSKASQIWSKVKDWSKERGLTANIDIFGCLFKIWTIGLKMAY